MSADAVQDYVEVRQMQFDIISNSVIILILLIIGIGIFLVINGGKG